MLSEASNERTRRICAGSRRHRHCVGPVSTELLTDVQGKAKKALAVSGCGSRPMANPRTACKDSARTDLYEVLGQLAPGSGRPARGNSCDDPSGRSGRDLASGKNMVPLLPVIHEPHCFLKAKSSARRVRDNDADGEHVPAKRRQRRNPSRWSI